MANNPPSERASASSPGVELSSSQLDINFEATRNTNENEQEYSGPSTASSPSQCTVYVRWVRFHKGKSDIKKFTYTKEDTMSSFMIGTIFECAFNKFGLFLLQNGVMVRGDTKVADAIKAQRVVQKFPSFAPPAVGVSAAMSQIYLPSSSPQPFFPQEWDERQIHSPHRRPADIEAIPPNELRVYVYDRDKPYIYENCFSDLMEDSKKNENEGDEMIEKQSEEILEEYNLKETKRAFREHTKGAQSVMEAAEFLERSLSEQIELGKFRYLSIRAFKEFVRRRFFLTCGVVSSHIAQFNARFTDRERVLRSGSTANISLLRKTRIDPDIQAWLAGRTPGLARFKPSSVPSATGTDSGGACDEDPVKRTRMFLSDLIPMSRYEQRFRDLFEEHVDIKEGLERQCTELCELERVLNDRVLFREEDLYQATCARLDSLRAGAQECARAAASILKTFEQDAKKLGEFETEARQNEMSTLLLAKAKSLRSTTHRTSREALATIRAQAERTYRSLDPQNKADEEATLALFLGLDRLFYAIVEFYNARVKLWTFELDKKVLRLQTPQQLIAAYKTFEAEVVHRCSFQRHLQAAVEKENKRWDEFLETVVPSVPPQLRLKPKADASRMPVELQEPQGYTPSFREEKLERSPEEVLQDENNALRAQIEMLKKDLEDRKLQISNLKEEISVLNGTDN